MKKTLALLLCTMMILGLVAGCGNDAQQSGDGKPQYLNIAITTDPATLDVQDRKSVV